MSAFFKPDMPDNTLYHVGVSSGKDSSAALIWMTRCSGIPVDRIVASFCDTGNEHDWTIEHIDLLSRTVHPITTIYPKLSYFDLALKKRRFPGAKSRFCTEELKIFPSQDFINGLKKQGVPVVAVSGNRSEESETRRTQLEWDYNGTLLCYQWRPLIRWTLAEVFAFHEIHGVPLNPLYAAGAERVGCWPCIMCRKKEVRIIAQKFPERIDQIRAAELNMKAVNGRFSSFFPNDKTPLRFRSRDYTGADGREHKVCTIDDVVRWSLTGKRAQGQWDDEPEIEPVSCNSGFCE
jgi:3'-phosphoadenosine 5'-phosphosulfate sulfotransferase (PAPS reductase)/FAD synthetase